MIEVPERVKDALRDGRRLKNYRFVVRSMHMVNVDTDIHTFEDSTSFSIPTDGNYVFTSTGSNPIAFVTVTQASGGSQGYSVSNGEVKSYRVGDELKLTNMANPVELKVRTQEERMAADFTIDNTSLVKESVKFDERMCSGDRLKFGLCEGTSLEFQYFNHPNIRGKNIQAFIDVQYEKDTIETITETVTEDITNHYTITSTAYTIEKTGTYVFPLVNDTNTFEMIDVIHNEDEVFYSWPVPLSGNPWEEYSIHLSEGDIIQLSNMKYDTAPMEMTETVTHEVTREETVKHWHTIPMGYYDVQECSTQFSTGIIKVVAYNKLKSDYLDAKANLEIQDNFEHMDSVYVSDLLSLMLGDYAIDKDEKSSTPFKPSKWGNYDVTVSGTYRYKSLNGDLGPMGPAIFGADVSTSSNISIRGSAAVRFAITDPSYPLKIRTSVDLDALDDNFLNFVIQSLKDADINVAVETMLSRLLNMTINQSGTTLTGWFFQIKVNYEDGTAKKYGKTLYQNGLADGTFKDLNSITLENVRSVDFIQPLYLSFGVLSGGLMPSIQGLNDTENRIRFSGANRNYEYWDNTLSTYVYKKYFTPKMPDGTDVDVQDYIDWFTTYNVLNLTDADLIQVSPTEIPDVTLRELQSATYETVCQFGKLDRETDLFSGVELNGSRLLPADDLYPSDTLYPKGGAEGSFKSQYSKLWTDSVGTQTFRYLIITYKGLEVDESGNEQEKDFTLQRTVNTHGTTDYNMSDNWLFRNLIWTAEQVGEYADAMVEKMRDIKWFPFEMWAAGLPYIETGDELEIITRDGTYTSYILQRNLNGIQNLQDTYINGTLDIF